jgi:hypothetical protein
MVCLTNRFANRIEDYDPEECPEPPVWLGIGICLFLQGLVIGAVAVVAVAVWIW